LHQAYPAPSRAASSTRHGTPPHRSKIPRCPVTIQPRHATDLVRHRGQVPARAAPARPAVPVDRLPGRVRVMAKIGYARVSTRGQKDDSQIDDLTA
jgi:hypothetical protein